MMNIFKTLKNKLTLLWYGLFHGMKAVDDTVFSQSGNDGGGISINQQVESQRVSHALLRGELTQEVLELRHRTYHVDREAKLCTYYSPTLCIKQSQKDKNKFVQYENSDNCEVVTIQPNKTCCETVLDGLKEFEGERKQEEYIIKIKRDHIARYRLEAYTKRLVVKKNNEGTHYLDFYVSIYPDDKDFTTAGFINEVKKIMEKQNKPLLYDFEEVSFITSHAYSMPDMVKFVFRNIHYKETLVFDGHYVVRFSATPQLQYDMISDFSDEKMADKYNKKEKKTLTLDLFGYNKQETYVCERCGKVVIYDTAAIDEEDISKPRLIDEEPTNESSNMEYRDLQIAEATFGKRLCRNCLQEYLEERKRREL